MTSKATTQTDVSAPRFLRFRRIEFGAGCLSGTAIVLWLHQFLATFGVSVPVTSAMAVAIAAGLSLGLLSRNWLSAEAISRTVRPAAWLVVAVWTAVFPTLLWLATSILGLVSVGALTSEATAFCILSVFATGLLMVPVAACVILADNAACDSRNTKKTQLSAWPYLGAAVGLISTPAFLAPLVGLPAIIVGVTLLAAAGFWRCLVRPAEVLPILPVDSPTSESLNYWIAGLSLVVGLLIPAMSRLAYRLMPGSPFEHFALWAGLVGGVGFGLLWSVFLTRRQKSVAGSDGPLAAALMTTVWPVVVLMVWGRLVNGLLTVNSTVSFVLLIMAIRIAVTATVAAPLGMVLGRLWSSAQNSRKSVATGVVSVTAGIILMRSTGGAPATVITFLCLIGLAMSVGRYWTLELPVLSGRQRLAGVVAVVCVASLPVINTNYRPDRAAKLLFSTQTFSALQSGISRELLPHLDDSRLLAVEEGRDSTWTVWRHRGSQLALRENGLPRGVVSTDPRTAPQFAGEIMPAVLPMVLHPRPRSVLMLGLGSTASLSSVLACPIESVTCMEGDAGLVHLIDTVITPLRGENPLDDDRVRFLNVSPSLAMFANTERYDVVVVNEGQPSVLSSTSGFTREFYESARKSLNADGLLCQRLQYADFGRQPIEDLLATLQSVFPQVALFDSAPGEMLFVATSKSTPLVDESVIDRCEATHIRRLMAQVGWDWSVLMNIGAISPDEVSTLTADLGTPNTITNGRFAFGLPQEVMRWSPPNLPKWQERQQMLNLHASRMLAWVGESPRVKDVQQRLADVIEQQRLIAEHPDHFWAYRKTLKERLSDRPRAAIRQVNHELKQSLHPEDERRKKYLELLGTAATSGSPQLNEVRALSQFAVPYDPLVSYFLHQESARLYDKTQGDDPAAQLHHWRYSVYFGPPNDRSLRNVIAALEVVNDHPELFDGPVDQWDEMNSLLEVLKQRSSLRLHTDKTASDFELVDAERSISIAKRTMAQMDILRDEAGIPEFDWQQRKTVLKRMLVRPMWKYHSQQAARLAQLQAKSKMMAAERPDETETR